MYESLGRTFYKGANCAVVVYDITNNKSFMNIKGWINKFKEQAGIQKFQ